MATRRELIEAIAGRYHAAARAEKKTILEEFVKVTELHRKHAIRALKRTKRESAAALPQSRMYGEAVRNSLTILWEAADRICGKRLKQAIPTLVDAMERHGHLQLETEVRPAPLHECRNDGSDAEAGPRSRPARPPEIGDPHAVEEQYRRADVQ